MIGIIAGFPTRLARMFRSFRKKNSLNYRTGWEIHPLIVDGNVVDINTKELTATLDCYKNDSPHVFSFRPSDKSKQLWIQDNIFPYFRFRWLPNTLILGDVDWGQYLATMNSILEEEELWDQSIKPQDVTSPLLLPEAYFNAKSQVRDLWYNAAISDGARMPAVVKNIHRFKEFHEKRDDSSKRIWLDQSANIYCCQGEKHGAAPFPRCLKFSYAIPTGFHYDVYSKDGGNITLGAKTKKYLNIDPHGSIRS